MFKIPIVRGRAFTDRDTDPSDVLRFMPSLVATSGECGVRAADAAMFLRRKMKRPGSFQAWSARRPVRSVFFCATCVDVSVRQFLTVLSATPTCRAPGPARSSCNHVGDFRNQRVRILGRETRPRAWSGHHGSEYCCRDGPGQCPLRKIGVEPSSNRISGSPETIHEPVSGDIGNKPATNR